ncbi:hypothetical protein QD357_32740, partial [Rhizobium sp. BR 317]
MTENGLPLRSELDTRDTTAACAGAKFAQEQSSAAADPMPSKATSSKAPSTARHAIGDESDIVYLAALDSGITRRKGRKGFLY